MNNNQRRKLANNDKNHHKEDLQKFHQNNKLGIEIYCLTASQAATYLHLIE